MHIINNVRLGAHEAGLCGENATPDQEQQHQNQTALRDQRQALD